MMTRKTLRFSALGAAFIAGGLMAAQGAHAAIISTDLSITESIPGVSSFNTDGADMAGMEVTVNFTGGGSETVSWAATGASSGAATGTGWSISVGGDTYFNAWNVDFGTLDVASLELDGRPGLTLFDIVNVVEGTPGSAFGRAFGSNLVDDALVAATYSNIVAIGADAAVGDLFALMTVDFSLVNNTAGATGRFSFLQDTDNDVRIEVPEPGTLGLLGAALVGFGMTRRRSRKAA